MKNITVLIANVITDDAIAILPSSFKPPNTAIICDYALSSIIFYDTYNYWLCTDIINIKFWFPLSLLIANSCHVIFFALTLMSSMVNIPAHVSHC